MRSPFFVFSGRRPLTMPPTQTSASDAGQLGDALRAERLELVAEPFQRMAAHVETQGLLFERQLLRLGPRWRIRQRDCDWARCHRAADRRTTPCRLRGRADAVRRARSRDRSPRTAGRASSGSGRRSSESNAPALTRLSSARLFTSRRSMCSHSANSESIRPSSVRAPTASTGSRPRRRSSPRRDRSARLRARP